MVTFIVVLLIVGLIAGAVARLLVPGPDHIGILGTILLGIAGSFVGGFLQSAGPVPHPVRASVPRYRHHRLHHRRDRRADPAAADRPGARPLPPPGLTASKI